MSCNTGTGLEMIQNNNCSTYSGGEKRKISIALSLIGDPRVIFLDEPTRGADPISRRKLYDIINQSKYSGQAIVMSSHRYVKKCKFITFKKYKMNTSLNQLVVIYQNKTYGVSNFKYLPIYSPADHLFIFIRNTNRRTE